MTINKNDVVDVNFTIRNSETQSIIYQHTSSDNISLNKDEPLFEVLKVLIGKNDTYQGNFEFEKIESNESVIDKIPRNGVLKKINYKLGQIIRYQVNPYKYGVVVNVTEDEISLETKNPFRRSNSLLKTEAKKVINN